MLGSGSSHEPTLKPALCRKNRPFDMLESSMWHACLLHVYAVHSYVHRTHARRLKPPPTESPVPWMPRHSGFKSDSTPNKLFARVARAIKSLKQLQTGVRVDHISMSPPPGAVSYT